MLILRFTAVWLVAMTKRYNDILNTISDKLGDRYSILNPVEHDNLLIEDEAYKMSRLYFWTIDALDTFKVTIEKSITEYKKARGFLVGFAIVDEEEARIARREHDAFSEFGLLLERISALRERTVTLRTGVRVSISQCSDFCSTLNICPFINKVTVV
jgi:hypothetical protein